MQIMNKFTLLAMLFYASVGFAQKYQLTGNGLKASVGGTDVELQFYNASTVRVLKSPQGRSFEKKKSCRYGSAGESQDFRERERKFRKT